MTGHQMNHVMYQETDGHVDTVATGKERRGGGEVDHHFRPVYLTARASQVMTNNWLSKVCGRIYYVIIVPRHEMTAFRQIALTFSGCATISCTRRSCTTIDDLAKAIPTYQQQCYACPGSRAKGCEAERTASDQRHHCDCWSALPHLVVGCERTSYRAKAGLGPHGRSCPQPR